MKTFRGWSRLTREKHVFLLALMLGLIVTTASGQRSNGSLRGQVKDQLGASVVGAVVTLVNAQGVETVVTTNSEGSYSFTNLAPRVYTLKAKAPGFAEFIKTSIDISASPQKFDVELRIEVKEEVSIEETSDIRQPGVEPDGNLNGRILRGADLEILSDDPDQMADDLRLLAAMTGGPDNVQFYVDGFSGARLPSKSSIREVRISTNPYGADMDSYGLGRVEIITKPGSEKLRGQASYNFNDESLNARNAFSPNRAPFQSRLFSGNLSGPIVPKKAAYFFDYERRDIDENAVISAAILSPSLEVTNFSQSVVTPQRRTSVSARLDYQLNRVNTLVVRYNYGRNNLENLGIGGLALPSRAFDLSATDHTLQITETAILGENVLNETRFQYLRTSVHRNGDNSQPGINVQGSFIGGGSQVGNASTTADRFELHNSTVWTRDRHTFKAGARLRGVHLTETAPTNFGGTFIFSSLDQYRQVLLGLPGARPAQFSITGGNPRATVNRLDLGLFLQDDWRMRPNFTISLGMRYETQTNIHDRADFSPRLAFAWAPGAKGDKSPKFVIRGGFGLFYTRFSEELTLEAKRSNGINQQRFLITSPDFFDDPPTAEELSAESQPQTIWRVDDDLKARYSMKASLSFERQLPRNTALSVSHVLERDMQALHARNINAPLPGTFDPADPASGVRPFGNIGNIFLYESGSNKTDNTFVINLSNRLNRKISLFATIGLSHETTDIMGSLGFPANSYDLRADHGRAETDVRAFARISGTINTFWGITLSPLIRFDSGRPFNIMTGRDTNGDGVFTDRPALATDLSKPGVIITKFGAFDPNPAPGQRLIPIYFGVGAGIFQVNLRASKTIRFGSPDKPQGRAQTGPKPYALTFTIQGINILNHTNFGSFIGNLGSPLFGTANSSLGSRRIDLGIRFSF